MKIGILGGGQLGRMLALAGYPLGHRFRVLDPAEDACAAHVAEHCRGGYDDDAALRRFVDGLDLVTWEFENVPVDSANVIAGSALVRPHSAALWEAQDRLREKRLFRSIGLATAKFAEAADRVELGRACAEIGYPCVIKTRRLGYDGKGQAIARGAEDLESAWQAIDAAAIVEAFVPFQRELSLIAVRDVVGHVVYYDWVENRHRAGILRTSRAPAAPRNEQAAREAERAVRRLLDRLEYVGVLAVEFFEVGDELLANEMAPRVHNSGHWTIEGAVTSQFENHIRAITGTPLGSTAAVGHSAMINLIGTLPDTRLLLSLEGLHLHLYGKAERAGRKLGHLTLVAPSADEREARLAQIHAASGSI